MTEKRPHYKLKFRIAATNALKRMMPVSQRSLIAQDDNPSEARGDFKRGF
jgi:hypothetical protein